MHGEHENGKTYVEKKPGSPPHTRGTPSSISDGLPQARITPAYTGNTIIAAFNDCFDKDHPRIHGEHPPKRLMLPVAIGSPPHTRGTQIYSLSGNTGFRITPAYTGNTLINFRLMFWQKDHPRIHGEHGLEFS